MTDWSQLPGRQYGCSRTGGEDILALIQEEPAGKPWESEDIRTWQPRPFNQQEYDLWAAGIARDAEVLRCGVAI